MPEVGDVLSQKYELLRLLGQGGMGAVFEARHALIGKRLAVKFLHPQLAEEPELVARFSREAQAAAAIGHRSIIDITDIGTAEDGSVYLVMEYLEGRDFNELIEGNRGTLQVDQVAYVAAQTLSALAAAHDAGIVHRDLKPHNIFLVATGQALPDIKLLDFGISKMTHSGNPEERLTKTGTMMGTPYYMAPEQAKGARDIDHRVDIYAMGVIMYEALSGTVPFTAENTLALVYEILTSDFVPLRVHRPDLPMQIEEIVRKAMDRNVDGRFATAEEMLQAVLPFMSDSARDRVTIPGRLPSAQLSSVDASMSSGATGTPTAATMPGSTPAVDVGTAPTMSASDGTMPASASAMSASDGTMPASAPAMSASDANMSWQSAVREEPDAPRSRLGLVVGLIGGALVLGILAVIGIVMLWSVGNDEPASASPPPAAPVPTGEAVPRPLPPPPTPSPPEAVDGMVTLTLVGVPEGARVYLDDLPVEGDVLRAPRSSDSHSVRIVSAEHRPWRRAVVFQADASLTVSLVPRSIPSEERTIRIEREPLVPSGESAARSEKRRR